MSAPDQVDSQQAARALLAFWRAAGVDMDEAEAVYAASPAAAPASPKPLAPAPKAAPRPSARRAPTPDAPLEAARAAAAAANNLAELKAAVEAFEGCALKATARTSVFCDGQLDAKVLLIGEAPGKEEDQVGKPFVGRSGQMLDRMLAAIGLDRSKNLLISNIIYWRPPGDRDPTSGEFAACMPFAERLIALAKPEMVIFCGKAPAQAMLRKDETVGKMRGRRLSYAAEGQAPVNAMVMLHPAYLLRRPLEKRAAWTDLLLLGAWLDELGVAREPSL